MKKKKLDHSNRDLIRRMITIENLVNLFSCSTVMADEARNVPKVVNFKRMCDLIMKFESEWLNEK